MRRKDTEIIGHLIGVTAIMEKFDSYLVVYWGSLYSNTDNLSKTLQNQSLSAAEGQQSANLTVKTLQSIRTDQMFDLFWEKATMSADKLSLDPPSIAIRACAVDRSDPTEAVVSVFIAEDPCGLQLPTERAGNLLSTLVGCAGN